MPDNQPADDVEKILTDEKAIEDRKQALIADLLKQREASNKALMKSLRSSDIRATAGAAATKPPQEIRSDRCRGGESEVLMDQLASPERYTARRPAKSLAL